jgi:hypothetical protein
VGELVLDLDILRKAGKGPYRPDDVQRLKQVMPGVSERRDPGTRPDGGCKASQLAS